MAACVLWIAGEVGMHPTRIGRMALVAALMALAPSAFAQTTPTSVTLTWTAPDELGASAIAYDVLRSPRARVFGPGAAECLETDDGADTQALDAENPGPEEAFFYLVVAFGLGAAVTKLRPA